MSERKKCGSCDCILFLDEIENLEGKVIAFSINTSAAGHRFGYCIQDDVKFRIVDLGDGKKKCISRSKVIGIPKPGCLPRTALLHLSQVIPKGDGTQDKLFLGYSFLKDGRYVGAVYLKNQCAAEKYVLLQAPYQYRVLLCDDDDHIALDIVEGKQVFPLREGQRLKQVEKSEEKLWEK